jgi:hypothetical protein
VIAQDPVRVAGALRNLFNGRQQYGRMRWVSEHFGISRPTLYRMEAKFLGTVCDGPGRRRNTGQDEELRQLRARVADLEAQQARLQGKIEQLHRQGQQVLARTRFWLIGLGLPARVIARLLRECFAVRANRTDILRLTRQYARRATQIMQEYFWPAAQDADLDEIFIENLPLLIASDARSLAILKTSLETERSVATWRVFLQDLPHLRRTTSDRGLAIRGAVARHGHLDVQSDIFHPKMLLRDELAVMETRCYALMTQEEALRQRVEKTRRRGRDCRAPAARLHKVAMRVRQAIACFDELEAAVHLAFDALRLTTAQGTLNSPTEARSDLQFAKTWIHAHLPAGWSRVKSALDDEALLTCLSELHAALAALAVDCPAPEDRNTVLVTLIRLWEDQAPRRYRGKSVLIPDPIRQRLQTRCTNLTQVQHRLFQILDELHRASSGIESINSRVGLYRYCKRRFSSDFANLIAVWHNLSPFEDGKRAGHSPARLLNTPLPNFDLFALFSVA